SADGPPPEPAPKRVNIKQVFLPIFQKAVSYASVKLVTIGGDLLPNSNQMESLKLPTNRPRKTYNRGNHLRCSSLGHYRSRYSQARGSHLLGFSTTQSSLQPESARSLLQIRRWTA